MYPNYKRTEELAGGSRMDSYFRCATEHEFFSTNSIDSKNATSGDALFIRAAKNRRIEENFSGVIWPRKRPTCIALQSGRGPYTSDMVCLACGPTSAPESREHIFAQWILKEFGSLNLMMGLSRQHHDGAVEQIRREYRLDSFKLKKICAPCNNGWMAALEESAKPLILGLINDSIQLSSLSVDEKDILARWAGKTAIVESHSVPAECPIESSYLKHLKLDLYRNPGTFAVAACKTEFLGFGHIQAGVIRDLVGGGKAAGNVIAIALPKLIFVCAVPMLETRYQCRLAPPLQGIWPDDARCWHPIKDTFMPLELRDSDSLFELVGRIELFHNLK